MMTTGQTATRLGPAGARITVSSRTPAVTGWVRRYFGPGWSAKAVCAQEQPFAQVVADIDPAMYGVYSDAVLADHPAEGVYAGARIFHMSGIDGTVYSVAPDQGIAYRVGGGTVTVAGLDTETVCRAAVRIARETVSDLLEGDGYTLLRCAAVTHNGQALLALGGANAGRTTTALLLASRRQPGLLSDDRVFVRAADDGTVHVLPYVAAAAVGLGLLDALGLYDTVRALLLEGESPHPAQSQRVTDALKAGVRTALFENGRRHEAKVLLFPGQLQNWVGLDLGGQATAAALLFPSIDPVAGRPCVTAATREAGSEVFTAATVTAGPGLPGLSARVTSAQNTRTTRLHRALGRLPSYEALLTHDADASAEALAKIVSRF